MILKRLIDIILSFVLIVLFSLSIWPIVFVVNCFFTSFHPMFFPLRYGKNHLIFKMYKFRSMKYGAPILPPYQFSKKDFESYETSFGKFLRKTSIDETPQFINVLLGKMSFIGPRPCAAINETILLDERNNQFPNPFIVRPGLTGLAQVNMFRTPEVKMKAKLDSDYVKKLSFWIDIVILIKTFTIVFRGK